jgi:hypothetical protein
MKGYYHRFLIVSKRKKESKTYNKEELGLILYYFIGRKQKIKKLK